VPAAAPKPAAPAAKPRPPITVEKIPDAELPKAGQPAPPSAKVAALGPVATPAPKLVTEPKPVERTSRFTPAPANDRAKLDNLASIATNTPMPQLVEGPRPAVRPAKALADAAALPDESGTAAKGTQVAALVPDQPATSITDMSPGTLGNGWVQAPEFDEDHPEELAYRPFPLAPLLTETATARDAPFGGLQHPDVAKTLDALDDVGAIQPMRFRPGQQVAEVMWAQQFQGKAVHLDALRELDQSRLVTGIENRAVQTSKR
jgi:hypothetical protein